MYRTLLATCGSENFRGLYSLKLRIFSSYFRGATRCKQRAVHCLSMKIHENELRTHAANLEQARCGTFTLLHSLPAAPHSICNEEMLSTLALLDSCGTGLSTQHKKSSFPCGETADTFASDCVLEVGLEPTQPSLAKGF